MLNSTRNRDYNQDPGEFAVFLDLVRSLRVLRYLEIGCRNGDTFRAVMGAIGAGGRGMAIDLPGNDAALMRLTAALADLAELGAVVDLAIGDSREPSVIDQATRHGNFDLILIDGDHRYDGARADWDNYAHLAPVVALHDAAAPPGWRSDGHLNEVPKLWGELKTQYLHQEIVMPGAKMGFGILYRKVLAVTPC